jgi:hypothetical protein
MPSMRHESCVTSLSWIPSEAVTGGTRLAFDAGFTHYDQPPPGEMDDLEDLRRQDRFRFGNQLRAWVEVDRTGSIVDHGYAGGGVMGRTTVRLGPAQHCFQAVGLPDIRRDAEVGDGYVRFVQTAGGRTGLPAPRRVRRRPFIQWQAPLVWTTLELTIRADGRAEAALVGASRFPRHWVYGPDGRLAQKSGLTDFAEWYRRSFGRHTPWGDEESEALVTAVETALERTLSAEMMHGGGGQPRVRRLRAGEALVREGDAGTDVFLVLDGVLRVEKDGRRLAEYGPGALLGERAHLEEGSRTSTLTAVTACRVAAVDGAALDRTALQELSAGHRREESPA